jgi:ubiquinone/menaquinone biosynthesis C-methylase UbiE
METTLREMDRVLRSGGHFYISEPSKCQTPVSRVLAVVGRVLRRGHVPQFPHGAESLEAPIDPRELTDLLDRMGMEYELRFLVHLGPLRRVLPEWAYLQVVRAFSFPWRRSCGDLLFVFGRKPVRAA